MACGDGLLDEVSSQMAKLYSQGEHERVNWISDFLLPDLSTNDRSSVRAFLYGYDSRWISDAPVVDVHSLAQNLLDTIQSQRNDAGISDRRLIFVAHSHGGLVVKEAFVIDSLDKSVAKVASQTDGILFFGTPHQGSSLTSFGEIISSLLSLWGADADILKPLMPGSRALWKLHGDFIRALTRSDNNKDKLLLLNFYEERKTTFFTILGLKWSHLGEQIYQRFHF